MNEDEIRDLLSNDLSVFEEGLIFVEKEKYIPPTLCTKSFLDLYAHDKNGNHVIIEVKISKQASREALHEISKYVEALKNHLGAKQEEIRVFIASSEWDELIVPFSSFVSDSKLDITGYQINFNPISCDLVKPLKLNNGRLLAPWHTMYFYKNEENFNNGITSIINYCERVELKDYIVIKLKENEKKLIEKKLEADENQIPYYYKYIIYFIADIQSIANYEKILKKDMHLYKEVKEYLQDCKTDEEIKYTYHENIMAINPSPTHDYLEIGYPAKLKMYLDQKIYEILEINKFGKFNKNTLLSDITILHEALAEDGETLQNFRDVINTNDKKKFSQKIEKIEKFLKFNPMWKNNIINILKDCLEEFPNTNLTISIFNPSTAIFNLYFSHFRENGILYLPSYTIQIDNFNTMIFGRLEYINKSLSLEELVNKYYDGNLEQLLFTTNWGAMDERDYEIMKDMGLIYSSFRADTVKGEKKVQKFNNGIWEPYDFYNKLDSTLLFPNYQDNVIKQMQFKILPRDNIWMFELHNFTMILEDSIKYKLPKRKSYFLNPPDKCNLCEFTLKSYKYMIDGQLNFHEAGAIMCPDCFNYFGKGIGYGIGQLYLNTKNGWLLVAGGKNDSK